MNDLMTPPAATLKRFQTIEFTVGAQFAALVANGDTSALSDKEALQFQAFEYEVRAGAPEGHTFMHWGIETDRRDEFARCEVTGFMGECFVFSGVFFLKGEVGP